MTGTADYIVSNIFLYLTVILVIAVLGRAIWWLTGFSREFIALANQRRERGESYRRQLARFLPMFSFGLEDCATSDSDTPKTDPHVLSIKTPVFHEAWSVPQRPKTVVAHRNGFRIGRRAHRRDPKPRVAAMGGR